MNGLKIMSVLNRQTNPSKERDKYDFYPTKPNFAFAHAMLAIHNLNSMYTDFTILDLGIGAGVYGKAINDAKQNYNPDDIFIVNGIDITLENLPETHNYDFIYNADFLTFEFDEKYDLIIGNPPYKNIIQFVKKATEITKRGGIISLLVKTSFLETIERFEFFKTIRPNTIHFLANRPIKNHAEPYCIVEFYNDYYDGWNKAGGTTYCEWVYVTKNGYKAL